MAHARAVRDAKVKELDAWKSLKVSKSLRAGDGIETAVDTRWALAWEMAEGGKTARARLAAKSFQDPDLKNGIVDTSGCGVCARPIGRLSPSLR